MTDATETHGEQIKKLRSMHEDLQEDMKTDQEERINKLHDDFASKMDQMAKHFDKTFDTHHKSMIAAQETKLAAMSKRYAVLFHICDAASLSDLRCMLRAACCPSSLADLRIAWSSYVHWSKCMPNSGS